MRFWGRLAAGAAALALLASNSGARRLIRNALELRREGARLDGLRREDASLHKDLKALQTDDNALEAVARKQGLLKPGEVEYRFPPEKEPVNSK